MNTLGLNRPLNSFGLAIPGAFWDVVVSGWRNVARFTLYLRRAIHFNLER